MAVLVWQCLLGSAPVYLCKLCRPVSGLPGRRALRIITGQILVLHAKTATRKRRAFSVVGLSTWNGLPLEVCLLPKDNENAFHKLLKTCLFRHSRLLEGVPYKFLNELMIRNLIHTQTLKN